MSGAVRLGLRENAGQFALLVGLNALVGAMGGQGGVPVEVRETLGMDDTRASAPAAELAPAFPRDRACSHITCSRTCEPRPPG
jgi:hypothetical protein